MRNLEKVFETAAGRTYVLRRISGEIQQGEFVSIMGPSGAGKSTLLAILGMLDSAWTGEFYFLGHPVHAMSHKQRVALNKEHIGFVFQQYHLIDDLTVAENLDIPLSYRNVKKSEREAIVADTLDRFGMVGKKDLYPRQLSGGQQQLVGVARAVIAKPQAHSRRRAHGQPALESGPRDHGIVQEAEQRRHDDHPGDALRGEREVRPPDHRAEGRVDHRVGGARHPQLSVQRTGALG